MSMPVEQPKTSRSLTVTLAIAFLALSVAVLLIASILEIYSSFQAQQEIVAGKQQLIAQDAANAVSSFIQEKFSVLETVARLSDPTSVSRAERERILGNLLGLQPAFGHLVLLDSQDQALVTVPPLSAVELEQLMQRFESDPSSQVEQHSRYISPVFLHEATRDPTVVIAVPTTDASGDVRGTLVAEVNLEFMWNLVDKLEIGETGSAYVVDREGDLIACGDVLRVLGGENVGHLKEVGEFISNPAPVDETGASISAGIDGTTIVGTYVPLGTPDWAVVTELPVVEAYREVIRGVAISIGVMLAMAMLAGLIGVNAARRLAVPLLNLTETATRITEGDMNLQATIEGPTEVASLARAFNSMTTQLRDLIGGLEQRVAERTGELEQRSAYREASTEVGHAVSSILDVDLLIQEVVELIHERFGLYYVGLFLADEAGEWAVLQAGTGEAGRAMLARGHRLRIGLEGMIGWSIANAQARVALYAEEDAVRTATPELPDTRSEAALPLRSRGRVLGALTIQHDQPNAFDDDAIAVLQSMADHVAVALDNARLFTESQATLETTRRIYSELRREAWVELLRFQPNLGYRSHAGGTTPIGEPRRTDGERALRGGITIQGDATGAEDGFPLAVPIKVRDDVIGVLDTYKPAEAGEWTPEEISLLETLTEQLGEALESARLYQETQRRAAREQLTREITDKMRRATSVEGIVQTAVDELFHVIKTSRTFVRLGTAPTAQGDGDGGDQVDQ
jgi:GAF domain-containing protein/HAMP domain-containing protein